MAGQKHYRVKAMAIGSHLTRGSVFDGETFGNYEDNDKGRSERQDYIERLLVANVIEEVAPPAPAEVVEPAAPDKAPEPPVELAAPAVKRDAPPEDQAADAKKK